jgi:hypothetical protein
MNNQLTTQQSGWLRLADIKTNLFNELQSSELAVQGALNAMGSDLPSVQEAMKQAKTILAEAKGKRLAFTRMIDEKLMVPSMAYEKRMAELIDAAGVKELELRKAAENEANKAAELNAEIAEYRAHITNEWYRIAAEYRQTLSGMVRHCYTTLLKQGVPVANIPDAMDDLANVLRSVQLPKPVKFQRRLVDDKTAKSIVSESRAYDPAPDLEAAIAELPDAFEMYSHDLLNAEEATKAIEQRAAAEATENAQRLAVEQATNVLIAQSEIVTIDTPRVKRELKIVVVESEQWASTIVANFLKNWQYCSKFIRVKSWAKLTIAQMADALAKHMSETGETIPNIQTEEICK